ncbi:MAG: chemotaxis protein CheA [Deltaproteobacteria bacterium]|nr:chemotaxis protein CheA [Deltaproteobacteria bacterium]
MADDYLDIFQQSYREEALELLAELEDSLLEWEENPADPDLLDRIFRAVHTVKGSGSMFGLDELASFAHEVETALSLAREGALEVSGRLIDLTLAARDLIQTMVEELDGGDPPDPDAVQALKADFSALTQGKGGDAPPPVETQGGEKTMGPETWWVRFEPSPDLFRRGTRVTGLLKELRELGECTVAARTGRIPPLDRIDADACFTFWDAVVTTEKGEEAIRDVFLFVEDDCKLIIERLEASPHLQAHAPMLLEFLETAEDPGPKDLKRLVRLAEDLSSAESSAQIRSKAKARKDAGADEDHSKALARAGREASGGGPVRAGQNGKGKNGKEISSIRVPAHRLDKLVDLVGEMVTVQARLTSASARLADEDLRRVSEEVERLTMELRDNAMSCRLVPIGTLFSRFKRMVRDLSHELGKDVAFSVFGGETELDKTVIERLGDPLVHILRNAADHGIESPEERAATGKHPQGTISVTAEHSGDYVLIRVADDGRGLDAEAIRAKAEKMGLCAPGAELSDRQIFDFIFMPGFSTTSRVTGVSGRGVGMDVVKKSVEALDGEILVSSEKGAGTVVTLKIPLTLAIIDGLLVAVGDDYYVIPVSSIEECVEFTREDIVRGRGRKTITVRGEMVPYIRLKDRFRLGVSMSEVEKVVIARAGEHRVGFVVDQVIGDHQTVIKSLGPVFRQVTDVSGATILGDGSVALILDVQRIIRDAHYEATV